MSDAAIYAHVPHVVVELHSHCNRDCPFCPRFHDRSGMRKDAGGDPVHARMPTGKVLWLLDELFKGGYRGPVSFHRLSDPLLDKRYPRFARYASERGMKVCDSTNGDVLRNNENLCRELDGVVDTFTIGLYDYATYSEKAAEIKFWTERFKKTQIRFSTPYEGLVPRQHSETYDWMAKDERVLDLPCQWRRTVLFVAYNGDGHLCCQDDYGAFGLGNVFEDGIEHVLFSKKRLEIVEALDQPGGRRKFALCSKCYAGSVPDALKSPAELAEDREIATSVKEIRDRFQAGTIDRETLTAQTNEALARRGKYQLSDQFAPADDRVQPEATAVLSGPMAE